MALALRYAVRSDLGLVRTNNEDSVYAGPRLLAVADGMGGHAAGEVASKIVIGALESLDEDRAVADLMSALRDAVMEANARIADAVRREPDLDGMGTTLTALRFTGARVGLVHVGDSRAYLLRGDLLAQITHDDTYVQHLVDTGKITAEEAKDHPRKSVILRAMRGEDIEPDVSIREARPGDRYLLCSDGLSDVVSAETILETLQVPGLQDCADRLVELALRGGGPDNVTVIVADVVESRVGESVDDVPVIAGAFMDPAAADVPGTDTPAERAAHISRPQRSAAPAPQEQRRRRWRKPVLIAVVVAVVVAGLVAAYAWTQSYYFVGKDGAEVAIFRGVNTSFGPLKFYEVAENTDLKLNELDPSTRAQVVGGITASSVADARRIVTTLHDEHLLPVCSTAVPASVSPPAPPTSTASATPSHPSSARTSPGAKTTPKTTARTPAGSTARTSPKPFGSGTATATATPGVSATPPSEPTPSLHVPTHTPEPGVDCRVVR